MRKKTFFTIISALVLCVLVLAPTLALAASGDASNLLEEIGEKAGIGTADTGQKQLVDIIGTIINVLLSLLGVIFLVLLIYGGFLWMTSRGNEDAVDKSKRLIQDAIIGLIIILAAYAISRFVIDALLKATEG
ncbi:hypothetical protein KJ969_05065 [Patescibacteria group bacterium]|nr:hypothetical protein [Patescibacteria group bacterium]MBU1921905.1 hypothetical protein [Patescibacteria group bacterium]